MSPLEGKIKEPFSLENASNLKYEVCVIILTRKYTEIFFKIFNTKTHVSNLMHFQDKMVNLFFLKKEALKNESDKKNIYSVFKYVLMADYF